MGLELTAAELDIVQAIVAQHVPERAVYVFGSRARGHAKPHADLDLLISGDEPLAAPVRAQLEMDFDDSDLPFRVDIVDEAQVRPDFVAQVRQDCRPLGVPTSAGCPTRPGR